jgi:predicted nuclease with TOPRIM domain
MKKIIFLILTFVFLFNPFYSDDFVNQKLKEQNELIDNIEFYITSMTETINSLTEDKENLTNTILNLQLSNLMMNKDLTSLKDNNSELKKALNSNKEDTHELLDVMGDIFAESEKLKKEKKSTNTFVQIMIPSATLPIIVNGIYLSVFTDEKMCGKVNIICGSTLFIVGELVWNYTRLFK